MTYDAIVVVALLMLATAAVLPFGTTDLRAGRNVPYTLYLTAVWLGYLAWCWRYGRMTLGMRAWRVIIAAEDGAAPGWGRCTLRFVTSLLSAAAGGLGFFVALTDPQRRTWHDRLSRTRLWQEPRRGRRTAQTDRRSA